MPNNLSLYILVGLGGFVGSIARYVVSLASQRFSIQWPIGTVAANVLGCFAIGVVISLSARSESVSPAARLALATGFCGGFTTMSSMIYEMAEMIRASQYFNAATYATGTLLLSMLAFFAGVVLIHVLARIGGLLWN